MGAVGSRTRIVWGNAAMAGRDFPYAAAITLAFFAIVSPRKSGMPGWKLGIPLLLFLAAFGIDGTNSYIYLLKSTAGGRLESIPNLYIPNNTLRLFTGSGMGIALAGQIGEMVADLFE